MRLHLRDLRGDLLRHPLRFAGQFLLRFRAQGGNLGFEIGQTLLHFGDTGLCGLAGGSGFEHIPLDLLSPALEKRAGVLSDHVAQCAGEQRKVRPFPQIAGTLLVLPGAMFRCCRGRMFGGRGRGVFLCRRDPGGQHEQAEHSHAALGSHAALRARTDSTI
jgi:hypothetical protein